MKYEDCEHSAVQLIPHKCIYNSSYVNCMNLLNFNIEFLCYGQSWSFQHECVVIWRKVLASLNLFLVARAFFFLVPGKNALLDSAN